METTITLTSEQESLIRRALYNHRVFILEQTKIENKNSNEWKDSEDKKEIDMIEWIYKLFNKIFFEHREYWYN